MPTVVRKMDKQGRIVVPKEWRKKYSGKEFVMKLEEEEIRLIPLRKADLTDHFDSIEVDLESDLADWHSVRRELRGG